MMAANNPQRLQFPLDKAGYISAVLQLRKQFMDREAYNYRTRASDLQRQYDEYQMLIAITEGISKGAFTYDQLQFYDNGEVRMTALAPSVEGE